MIMGTVFALITGRRMGCKQRLVLHKTLGETGLSGRVRMVLLARLALQSAGALFLATGFAQDMAGGSVA